MSFDFHDILYIFYFCIVCFINASSIKRNYKVIFGVLEKSFENNCIFSSLGSASVPENYPLRSSHRVEFHGWNWFMAVCGLDNPIDSDLGQFLLSERMLHLTHLKLI